MAARQQALQESMDDVEITRREGMSRGGLFSPFLAHFACWLSSWVTLLSAECRLRNALAATLGDWIDSGTQQAIRELARMMQTVGVTSVHA